MMKSKLGPMDRPNDGSTGKSFVKAKLNYVLLLVIGILGVTFTHTSCEKEKTAPVVTPLSQNDSVRINSNNIDSLLQHIEYFKKTDNKRALLASYKAAAVLYQSKYDFARTISCQRKRMEVAQQLNNHLEVMRSLLELGHYSRRIGEYDQASAYYYDILTYSYNPRNEVAADTVGKYMNLALTSIGEIFIEQENWRMATDVCKSALKKDIAHNDTAQMSRNNRNLGYIYESTNKLDSAWMYYQKAYELTSAANLSIGSAMCRMHFGELYEKDGKLDKALSELQVAANLLKDTDERWYWVRTSIAIARVYMKKNDSENFNKYCDDALEAARGIGAVQLISDLYYLKYEWNVKNNSSQKALDNYILSKTYSDSVINLVKINQMFNTRLNFYEGSHRSEIKSLQKEYQYEKTFRKHMTLTFLAVLLLVTGIIVGLIYTLHVKRKMSTALQKVERMRSDFFTNVTHEFRTPLTVILGFCEQLQDSSNHSEENLKRIGNMITYHGRELLTLVNQLLDFSRVQSSLGNVRWSRGNIIAYLDMLVDSFQDLANSKHNELVFMSKEKSVEMDFISDYLDKIVRNLLSNAFKFTPEYGKIYITASVEKNKLVLYIADTGKGISEEDKPHIFDPFYQGKSESFSIGSGIGLSLVHQLVMAMDGTIDVKSSLNEGTIFILKFPLKHGDSAYEEFDMYTMNVERIQNIVTTQDEDLPIGKDADETTPLVLIVEDNMDVAYYIGSQLEQKYTLKYARNGKLALDLANALIPDIIISDLVMPEMNGYEVCREVRHSELLNHIPIVLISALNTEDDRMKGLEAGADAYLSKPFNSSELNERVEYLLEQRKLLRKKYSNTLEKSSTEEDLNDSDQQFLNKLIDMAYSEMASGTVNADTIAVKMQMNRQQINRKVQSITGESLVSYLMRIRLNKAKSLLDLPENLLIGEIAMKCGFEDIAYFSRIFKKTYNMTPSQYKKRIKD